MSTLATRLLAVAVVLGGLATLRAADAPPDLADLRDAIKAALKKGSNVGEIAAAAEALEKALAKGFVAPRPGATAPAPAELTALRDAVEAAARKGENVEDIRAEVEAVEKAVTGQVLARPKPPATVDPPVRPGLRPDVFPRPLPFQVPEFRGGGVNPEELQKALDLMMRLQNANDADALKRLEEAREMMLKALAGRGLDVPNFPAFPDLDLPVRPAARPRLGVRLEKPSPVLVEQLGLEAGRGVALVEVVEGSAAEKAGFKAHDIVLEFAGKAVTDVPEDFTRQVNEAKAGKVDAVVLRKGKKVELRGIELAGDPAPVRPVRPIRPLPVRPALPALPALPAFPALPGLKGANGLPGFPGLPGVDGLPGLKGANGLPAAAGQAGDSTSVTIDGERFAIKATKGGVIYVLEGPLENGGPVLDAVTVEDGGKTHKAAAVDKLPAEYRPAAEELLRTIGGVRRGR